MSSLSLSSRGDQPLSFSMPERGQAPQVLRTFAGEEIPLLKPICAAEEELLSVPVPDGITSSAPAGRGICPRRARRGLRAAKMRAAQGETCAQRGGTFRPAHAALSQQATCGHVSSCTARGVDGTDAGRRYAQRTAAILRPGGAVPAGRRPGRPARAGAATT